MNIRLLPIVLGVTFASVAHANAGLTSAGIDPNANNPAPQEPTLAQVAPITAAATAPAVAAAAGVPATVVAASGAAPAAGNAASNGAAPAGAATARAALPPPPLDPATLPVSVIRPISKAADATNPAVTPDAASSAAVAPASAAHEDAPARTSPRIAPAIGSVTPRPITTPASGLNARTDSAARIAPAPAVEETPDTSSSSFIFYSGSGLAAFILLLSAAAFLRGRNADSAPPR